MATTPVMAEHSIRKALIHHWPEYLMEAAGLGLFMLSACLFATLLEYPASPVRQTLNEPLIRRLLMGLAMGCTASGIVYSPWGKQSGAHLNPAVTLTFWRLGKISSWDALFYGLAQTLGGVSGMLLASRILQDKLAHPGVHYITTVPGVYGVGVAFCAEFIISCVLMLVVLSVSNTPHLARWTGVCAGMLVAMYITLEAPLSGMSMNPARTSGSGVLSHTWTAWWLYVTAPPGGMLLAAEIYLRCPGARRVACAKLHHHNTKRCIFRCGYKGEAATYVYV